MEKNKDKIKEKTPGIDSFPTDETPTPTKILRMADMDLFQEYKMENPFDASFRKAAEKNGASATDIIATSLNAAIADIPESDSLNTPNIFMSESSMTATTTSRPVILRSHSHNKVATSGIPIASVQPVKTLKPIAPNPAPLVVGGAGQISDNAMLLLKFPGGETVKLSNLPFVKCDSHSNSSIPPPVNNDTRLKLKRTLKTATRTESMLNYSSSTSSSSSSGTSSSITPVNTADNSKEDLKERNRMSAQRSRMKKRQHIETLLDSCNQRKRENDSLKSENKMLMDENMKLRRLLSDHLDCSVTVRTGARDVLAAELSIHKVQPNIRTHSIETQTPEYDFNETVGQVSREEFAYPEPIVPSPPQTEAEDLRVDTRIKEEENKQDPSVVSEVSVSQATSAGPSVVAKKTSVKHTLALHCQKVGNERTIKKTNKGVVARRLKDKLQILKQKLAEDETTLSDIKSGNL